MNRDNFSTYTAADYILAHKHSSNHKELILLDDTCGCFHCLNIFSPKEINTWITDVSGTAICPYCAIDSIIGLSSGYVIETWFLKQMHDYWFGE